MAENILDLQGRTDKDIHIVIGAGHLWPKINIQKLDQLGLNNSIFLDHQKRIIGPRLVEMIGECEIFKKNVLIFLQTIYQVTNLYFT